jgi:hypothetical protein
LAILYRFSNSFLCKKTCLFICIIQYIIIGNVGLSGFHIFYWKAAFQYLLFSFSWSYFPFLNVSQTNRDEFINVISPRRRSDCLTSERKINDLQFPINPRRLTFPKWKILQIKNRKINIEHKRFNLNSISSLSFNSYSRKSRHNLQSFESASV